MHKKSSAGLLAILLTASAYADLSNPQKQQRIQATYQKAATLSNQSELQAGSSDARKIVLPESILPLESLRSKFKALGRQLKTDFYDNMEISPQISLLQKSNCQPEITLPIGIEVKPGHLNGTITLFVCADGSYGKLSIHKRVLMNNKVYDRKGNKNDRIGETPALSRNYQTSEGIKSTVLGWENFNDEIVTLDLVEGVELTSVKSFRGEPDRTKMIAKALLGINLQEDSSKAAK